MRAYGYAGPEEIARRARGGPPAQPVADLEDLARALASDPDADDGLTYVVDRGGRLRLAPRWSDFELSTFDFFQRHSRTNTRRRYSTHATPSHSSTFARA